MGSNLTKTASYFSKAFLCESKFVCFAFGTVLLGFVWGNIAAIKARIEIHTGDSEFLMHHCV